MRVNLEITDRSKFLQQVVKASHIPYLLVYCLSPWIISALTTFHKFSMQLRSGDEGDHSISRSPLMLFDAKNSQVSLDAWAGALPCMNIHICLNVRFWERYEGNELSVKNSMQHLQSILTQSGTLNGPIRLLPTVPAQNLTPPPSCWRLSLIGTLLPSRIQLCDQQSDPSSFARDSSVNITLEKSTFRYFFAYETILTLFLCIMNGLDVGLTSFRSCLRGYNASEKIPERLQLLQKCLCCCVRVILRLQMLLFSYLEVKTCFCICRIVLYVQNLCH